MKKSLRITTLCIGILWGFSIPGHCVENGWTLGFSENFKEKDWPTRWKFTGSAGPTDRGGIRNLGGEINAWLINDFKAPAVRVEFEAQMEAPDKAGLLGDLTCRIGGGPESKNVPTCTIQFGAEFNTMNRISFPGMPDVTAKDPAIQTGQWYRIIAEVNGRVASLTIDGKKALTALLPAELPEHYIRFYTWCGQAVFRDVKIYTKAEADPIPAELKPSEKETFVEPVQELSPWREWSVPPVTDVKPCAMEKKRMALSVSNPSPFAGAWPITMGVPVPEKTLWDVNAVRVINEKGDEVPAEFRVAATWTQGGSIRWLHLDFQPELQPDTLSAYFVEFGNRVRRAAVAKPITVAEDDKSIVIDTGNLKAVISKKRGSLIEAAWLDLNKDRNYADDEQVVKPTGEKGGYFITDKGERFTTTAPDKQYTAVVESAGPMRAVIRTRGWYQNEKGERACYYVNRLYFYRGQPRVRLFTTWIITVDTDKFRFSDVAARFPIALAGEKSAGLGVNAEKPYALTASAKPSALEAQTTRHEGFIREGEKKTALKDAGGWGDLSDSRKGITVTVFDMEKQWPNALEIKPDEIVFHAFSSEGGTNLDFSFNFLKHYWGETTYQRFENDGMRVGYNASYTNRIFNACGLAKTHEIVLRFHGKEDGKNIASFAETAQKMPTAWMDPSWACAAMVAGPLHPYDPKQFQKIEEAIPAKFDEFLGVLDRLSPIYGFYDYGMGMPHYIQPMGRNAAGEVLWTYTGYRREYDLGYGNPVVPWLLFLRSGDRRYGRYGIAFSRHCMDAHAHHWTNPRLKKQIGWTSADHGSWVYDSEGVSFTFNNWMEYLFLDYYLTGYERAMDVAVQFIDAAYEENVVKHGFFTYCGAAGVWHGNAALMYRATWEDKQKELYDVMEKIQLGARCKQCGGFSVDSGPHPEGEHGQTHREGWREYGLYHGTLVPGHNPEVDEALVELGKLNLKKSWSARPSYTTGGFCHWAAYQKTKDPRFVKFAQLRMNDGVPSLTGYDGLAPLRQLLRWMPLSLFPGAENVQVPDVKKQ